MNQIEEYKKYEMDYESLSIDNECEEEGTLYTMHMRQEYGVVEIVQEAQVGIGGHRWAQGGYDIWFSGLRKLNRKSKIKPEMRIVKST